MSEPPKQFEEEVVVFEFEEVVDLDELDERERQGLADIAAGRGISHDAVVRWLKSLSTDHPLPRPKCGD